MPKDTLRNAYGLTTNEASKVRCKTGAGVIGRGLATRNGTGPMPGHAHACELHTTRRVAQSSGIMPELTYFDEVCGLLPKEYAEQVSTLPSSSHEILDKVFRFVAGGSYPEESSPKIHQAWADGQARSQKRFQELKSQSSHKRPRDEDDSADSQGSKRTKTDQDDTPVFTLHNISVSSPIRKRVDVTVHKSTLQLLNPTTSSVELNLPLATFKRVFLLPTRGKAKPHCTIVLMSDDAPTSNSKQLIFGVDATPPPYNTTDYTADASGDNTRHPKGTPILPHLRTFLSHLPFPTLEPSLSAFKSALGDVPGTEGYRGAKPGTLWFFSEGILWDSKSCEFWSLSDIVNGELPGVRTVSATGRNCSVVLCRKVPPAEGEEDDEEDVEETDIGMVDGREQEPILRWVKSNRHLFGKTPSPATNGTSPEKPPRPDDSDEEDSDFVDDDDSDGGEPTSDSDSDSDNDAGGGGNAEDEEEEAVGSGSGSDDDEVEELDPARHPLLRPAMPRMSRAAIEAAVGVVQEEFLGSKTLEADADGEEDDDEEDELDD
ncbi:hypothetical protein K474DRAFT_1678771 [Panus rudis PR-1116 ss-1]|nr:hypothetical protein K474DRAFT_1678771 [Panus rudis PR-1116 ss-1]